MPIARIENDAIAEVRDLDLSAVPQHKRVTSWLPIEGEQPFFKTALETLTGPVYVIEPTRVLRTWTVERRPLAEQQAAVKVEARNRILARFPEWKQANLTARGVELQDIWRLNGAWTAQEQAEADALNAVWAWIKSVRAASDAIEAMSPIPHDYASDQYWPA
jgi:hypothetical protein